MQRHEAIHRRGFLSKGVFYCLLAIVGTSVPAAVFSGHNWFLATSATFLAITYVWFVLSTWRVIQLESEPNWRRHWQRSRHNRAGAESEPRRRFKRDGSRARRLTTNRHKRVGTLAIDGRQAQAARAAHLGHACKVQESTSRANAA